MGAGAVLALLLIVVGALLGSGGLVLAGVVTALVIAVQSVWSRYGLRSLEYERHLSATRVPWGERIELDLVVRNAKALPLPWLQIDDLVTHGADDRGPAADRIGPARRRRAARHLERRLVRARDPPIPDRRQSPRDVPLHGRRAASGRPLRAHDPLRGTSAPRRPIGSSRGSCPSGPPLPRARRSGRPARPGACSRSRHSSRASGRTSRAIRCAGSTGRRPHASADL